MKNNNLENFYNFIINSPALNGSKISNKKEINYGLQFLIDGNIVRIYESKKKGLTLDTSQCNDDELILKLGSIYSSFTGEKKENSPVTVYPLMPPPLAGSDEVGKGDYFSPLIVSSVFLTENEYKILDTLGVKDSKSLSDTNIKKLAKEIKAVTSNYSIVKISQKKYNELYKKIKNINIILAWAHTQAIKNLYEKISFDNVLIDKFGREETIKNNLLKINKNFKIRFAPKAEQNLAVAAASILARDELLSTIQRMKNYYKTDFPLGANKIVVRSGKKFVKEYSKEELNMVAKLHFKTTNDILK